MGTNRVRRGGSWNNKARNVRAAYRNYNDPGNRNNNLGFRCARAHAWSGCSLPETGSYPVRFARQTAIGLRCASIQWEKTHRNSLFFRNVMILEEKISHPLVTGCPPDWASGWGQDEHGIWLALTVEHVEQRMRWIPPGQFMMGSPETEAGRSGRETATPGYAHARVLAVRYAGHATSLGSRDGE